MLNFKVIDGHSIFPARGFFLLKLLKCSNNLDQFPKVRRTCLCGCLTSGAASPGSRWTAWCSTGSPAPWTTSRWEATTWPWLACTPGTSRWVMRNLEMLFDFEECLCFRVNCLCAQCTDWVRTCFCTWVLSELGNVDQSIMFHWERTLTSKTRLKKTGYNK